MRRPALAGTSSARARVESVGAPASVALRAEPLDAADDARLRTAWNEARAEEYGELISECGKLVDEINKEFAKQKFTLVELGEEEAELDKLKRWHERITTRDVCGCDRAGDAETAMEQASKAVARYTAAVFDRTHGAAEIENNVTGEPASDEAEAER